MTRITILSLLAVTVCGWVPAHAADPSARGTNPALSPSTQRGLDYARRMESGERELAAGSAAAAVVAFREAIALFTDDGRSHRDLAKALLLTTAFAEAAHEYETARQLGWGEAAPMALAIASCHLQAGDRERALHWIGEAVRSRLKERGSLLQDERFAALRTEARFRALAAGPAPAAANRVAGWSSDLDFLVSELHRLHPRFVHELPDGFGPRLATLRSNLSRLTDQEIVLEVMALFASVGDSHTVLFPFGMKLGALSQLPLATHLFSDGLFVLRAPDAHPEVLGARITRIGGRTVDELMAGLPEFISRDNDRFLGFAAPFALSLPQLLHRLGAEVGKAGVNLDLIRRDGVAVAVTIPIPIDPIDPEKLQFKLTAPQADTPAPLWLSRPEQNFWLTRLSPAAVYVQINQCHDTDSETLAAFADRLTAEVRPAATKNLIVDVRRNNGGDEDSVRVVAAAMIAFQVERPTARVFVLIGPNTLSAAQNFISTLDQWMTVTFVGEPSGSRPDHTGDDTLVVLPYSGLMGSIACALHQTTFRDSRPWISPAVPVSLSSQDYFAQRDPVLEAVLREIGAGGVSSGVAGARCGRR